MRKNKHYQFTLVLDIDEQTENLEDALYEANCDDALINFRNGTVFLDFDRKASSLEEAIMSAIRDVESSHLNVKVINVAPENWVSESDVAKRLHLKRQTVSLWIKGERRKSTPFPKPTLKLSDRSPLWKWSEIAQWLYKNNLIDEEEIVENAVFLEHINGALEERDISARKTRHNILKKIEAFAH